MAQRGSLAAAFCILLASGPLSHAAQPVDSVAAQAQLAGSYRRSVLSFEPNAGQAGQQVKFLARGSDYGLFLTGKEAVLALTKGAKSHPGIREGNKPTQGDIIRMGLVGAQPSIYVTGQDPLPGVVNYIRGNDPSAWRTNVPTYGKVEYAGVYPGVDLVYYGNQSQLEYDFLVAPGADPGLIQVSFEGARRLRLDRGGDLQVFGRHGSIVFHEPVLYQQDSAGRKTLISGHFQVAGNKSVRFAIGSYDRSRALVIDPVLVYSTYFGGSSTDFGDAISVDEDGNAYVMGGTTSSDFPITAGVYDSTLLAEFGNAIFVSKITPDATGPVWSTYMGGHNRDVANQIQVDSEGNVFVAGVAYSADFPVTKGAFQTKYTNPAGDGFVAKLNSTGSALLYSTLLSGSLDPSSCGPDVISDLAIDSEGEAFVTGYACTSDFPVTKGAYQTKNNEGAKDTTPFVTKLNATGTALVYSTLLGSTNGEYGFGITVDKTGNAYVTGGTYSEFFPTTLGAYQTIDNSTILKGRNAFLTKLNPTGTALIWSTLLGGSGDDTGVGVALDPSGNVAVSGFTWSTDFPVTANAYQTKFKLPRDYGSSPDGSTFITKFNSEGSALVGSTYLSGSSLPGDPMTRMAVGSDGSVTVVGLSYSPDFPVTNTAYQTKNNNPKGGNGFISKLDGTLSELLYSTFLGTTGNKFGQGEITNGVALDSKGNTYVTGQTFSSNFPTTKGVFQVVNRTGTNSTAYISKFALGSYTTVVATTTKLQSSLNPQGKGDAVTFTASVTADSKAVTTGKVAFMVDGASAATVALDSAGHATYTTSSLSVGDHKISASYAGATGYSASASTTLTQVITQSVVATPVFSPAAGTYGSELTVTLTEATTGATVYYTADGSTPTKSSTPYTVPIVLAEPTTIKAIAYAPGQTQSIIGSATYSVITSPTVLSAAATAIATPSAALHAIVNEFGAANATVWFVYGTEKTALTSITYKKKLTATLGNQSVGIPITGLAPKTTYYFQPVASSVGGTSYGAILSFTTN
jgi:hypothetical protein